MGRQENAPKAKPSSADVPVSVSDYRDLADFRQALRTFLRFAEEQARLVGITPQQHMLLLVIRAHPSYPEVSVGDAAHGLQIRHTSASRLIERAVQRGLLNRREATADRRMAYVSLTDEGQEILDRVVRATKSELSVLEDALFRDSLRQALQAPGSRRGERTV
jgi:DNA-binding MarR family transcriptional regulator